MGLLTKQLRSTDEDKVMGLMKVRIDGGELNFIDGKLASIDDFKKAPRTSEIFDMVEEGEAFQFQEGEFVLDRNLNPVKIIPIKRPLSTVSIELSPTFLRGYKPKQKPKHFLDNPLKKEIGQLSKIIKKEMFKIFLQDGWEAERYLGRQDGEIVTISKKWTPNKHPLEFKSRSMSDIRIEYFDSNYYTGHEGYGEYIKKNIDKSLSILGLKEGKNYSIEGEIDIKYLFHKRIEI